uniref:Ankyrin repeat domain 31 n=1 Tax=Xenopus tropicalis TaxID=8364 RepID=A0A803K6E0_XENTR
MDQSSCSLVERNESEAYDSDETLIDGYISESDEEDAWLCYKDNILPTPETGFCAKDADHLPPPISHEASYDIMSAGVNFPGGDATTNVTKEKELVATPEKTYIHHGIDDTAKGEAVSDKIETEYINNRETSFITSSSFEELNISDLLKSPGGSELFKLSETEFEHYLSCIDVATESNSILTPELVAAINMLEGEAYTDHWAGSFTEEGVDKEKPAEEEDQFRKAVLGELDEDFTEISSHNRKNSQEEQIHEQLSPRTEQDSIEKELSSYNFEQNYLERVLEEETCNIRDADWQEHCTERHHSNSKVEGKKFLRTQIVPDCARKSNRQNEDETETMDTRQENSNMLDIMQTNDSTTSIKDRICCTAGIRRSQRISKRRASIEQSIYKNTLHNIHKRNHMGETQLHLSAKKGDLASLRILLKAGVNVNQKDNAGWTAMHEASCKGFTDIIVELLHAGADVNSKSLDGILPIHDAVMGNHYKAAKLLLEFGADPFEKDENQENAFDKSCSKGMTQLLISYSRTLQTASQENVSEISEGDNMQDKANSHASSVTPRNPTRERCGTLLYTLDTSEDTNNRQGKLLLKEILTPLDAEETCLVKANLNDVVKMQKNEREILAKRASVDSFKQGILREKIAELAARQNILQQVVCQQKEVSQKIAAHKQSKKSDAYRLEQSSFLHSCNMSPGRNQMPAVWSVSAGLDASIANGSTEATVVPAISGSPDLENNTLQEILMRSIGIGDIPANVVTAKESTANGKRLKEKSLEIENAFLDLGSSFSSSPSTLQNVTNEHLAFTNTLCMSTNPVPVTSTLIIKETGKTMVQNTNPVRHSYQMPHTEHSHTHHADMVSHQKEKMSWFSVNNLTSVGKPHHGMVDQASTSHVASVQSNPVQRSESLSTAKSHTGRAIRQRPNKVHIKDLIKNGKLKPGEDVLEFKIQEYSHKASLLPDGTIKDSTGMIYLELAHWLKAILGNNISISWKYIINKVTYCGKDLKSCILQKDPMSREFLQPTSDSQAAALPSMSSSIQKEPLHVFRIKDILIFDNDEFLPCHIMDRYWKKFIDSDSLDL